LEDRDERYVARSVDTAAEGALSDPGERRSGREPAPVEGTAELPERAPHPGTSPRPPRARIEGVEAGVAAGLVPSAGGGREGGNTSGASETPAHPDAGEADDLDHSAVHADDKDASSAGSGVSSSFAARATSPSLPDWRDPPTREVPRVLLEHPLADPGPAYPGPIWREVESDWDHDDVTFADIVSEGASVAEHGLSLDEPDPFGFDFEIDEGTVAERSGITECGGRGVDSVLETALDNSTEPV